MRVISQTALRPHVLQLPAQTLAAKYRTLAERMLNANGVTWGASSRERARAVVGWFARFAVHPQTFLHPDGGQLNLDVLPTGETWATYNALFNATSTITRDQAFWYSFFPNGMIMLEKLVGTVAADGTVADNGLLTEYANGKWRIRDFNGWRAPQCTLQCKMAQVILAAVGIPSIDISTTGHDPMAFYEIETGKWLYIDPTFGEMQTLLDSYQTPLDLLETSLSGYSTSIIGEKLPGADYIPVGYFTSPNVTPGGMAFMTIHTAPQWAGGLTDRAPYRFGNLPSQSAANDRVGTAASLMPELGVGIVSLERIGRTAEVRLRSNWLAHTAFQRSVDGGGTWSACTAIDYVAEEFGEVRYRSVDPDGFAGTPAIITV